MGARALPWIGIAFALVVASIGALSVAGADETSARRGSMSVQTAAPAPSPGQASPAPADPLNAPPQWSRAAGVAPVERGQILISEPGRPLPPRLAPFESVRTLRTVLRRPSGEAGPLPAVVFAHGFNAEPEDYDLLLDAWAAAGYIVAAPELPDSARNLPGEPGRDDLGAQTADLRAVISALLDGRAGPVDPRRVAVAGHSDGGTAVAEMLFTPQGTDPRVSAYLVLSGANPIDSTGTYRAPGPVLLAVGAADENGNLDEAESMFAIAGRPSAFIEAPAGDHMSMYVTTGPLADAVRAETVRFLAAALGGDPSSPSPLMRLAPTDSPYLAVAVRP